MFVTDIYDLRRLNRPMIFQQMDPHDTARRAQRNRIHLDLYLPDGQVAARKQAALAAGGRYTCDGDGTIADPDSIWLWRKRVVLEGCRDQTRPRTGWGTFGDADEGTPRRGPRKPVREVR